MQKIANENSYDAQTEYLCDEMQLNNMKSTIAEGMKSIYTDMTTLSNNKINSDYSSGC